MKHLFLAVAFLFVLNGNSQTSISNQPDLISAENERPKLVVGIVVDQMRYDYLTRFYAHYGEGGFKRMMREGFNCKNNHFNYVPTYTGPGHASVYTGATPKYHGIISNSWYSKKEKKYVYCAGDDSVQSVGTTADDGQMSPHRMKTTTFSDENRLFTQMQGKTIGVSIKDRGAILPAGHTANGVYWYNGDDEGKFITSTHYMNELPKWVGYFNNKKYADKYLNQDWETFYNIKKYTESGSDLNNFEGGFKGKETATFPYDLKKLRKENGNYSLLSGTPFGNSIVADFAIASIDGEQLGQDNFTDVLAISFSSTDYVGHNFGVNSKEVQDTYIRLDQDIERLFNALDKKVGKSNYTVFLTADHAAVNVPAYLQSVKIPAGYIDNKAQKEKFSTFLNDTFGSADVVENISNHQVFLNREKLEEFDLDLDDVQEAIVDEIITYDNIDKAYTAMALNATSYDRGIEKLLQNGYNQKRSGDVLFVYAPAYISYSKTGSTHGSGFNYDTHVPLLFMGKGIKQGSSIKQTTITDIAPTICALLNMSLPNFTVGEPLEFVLAP